jgi:1-deoxy-D-xylulose-5-phosphate reductoisomerase
MKKRIAILGSTGSIGTQALEVVRKFPQKFEVEILTAHSNADLLIQQALEFKPDSVVITRDEAFQKVKDALWSENIKVFKGEESVCQIVESENIDLVLVALVGFAGLKPTLAAIDAGKEIALANKETLVVAGAIVTARAKEKGVNIYPVDSEHSAIFQCLVGEFHNPVEKLILTASGGPFRQKTLDELKNVKKEQALRHPNWNMGCKITIDSATMMNKGLEVIEAYWLFGIPANKIEVIIHPQSIVHSLVQFKDGAVKAQMGLPDMKLPILYAFTYPYRFETDFPRFNFTDYPELTFAQPDIEKFRNLALAYKALEKGGNMPCILNAANEIAVAAFLKDRLGFLEIPDIIQKSMENMGFAEKPDIDDLLLIDGETRRYANSLIY